jgi:beta-galactosidase
MPGNSTNTSLRKLLFTVCVPALMHATLAANGQQIKKPVRERISINEGWKFMRYNADPDKLIYDERPVIVNRNDNVVADTRPTESVLATSSGKVLKKWILPTANDFIADTARHHQRPEGNPGSDFPFVQNNFNDEAWESVDLPHDWAIKGPFYTEANAIVGGGMGRLPVQGVAWYRKKLNITAEDTRKFIYLDIDGAMSYAMVWLNGKLVGGWPYGYNSFRLDLTPYLKPGGDNQLAIRLDNPTNSSRWYPGAGLYRNVWLTKVNAMHVLQWGSFISSKNVSASSAVINLVVDIENKAGIDQHIEIVTEVYALNAGMEKFGKRITSFPKLVSTVRAGSKVKIKNSVIIEKPLLWGPPPSQKPNLYTAISRLYADGKLMDEYETRFGIRSVKFDPKKVCW